MKNMFRGIVVLMVLVLMFGGIIENAYANIHQDCSCCSNQCQSKEKCHENTKQCSCGYPVIFQVYLLSNDTLPGLACLGFFVSKPRFNYAYLSAKDIFHPPKVNLF